MNRFKKISALLLALLMTLTVMPTMEAHASSITVSASPLSTTIGTTPIANLVNQINAGGATYTYVDNEGNTATGKVTADMCYLYGTFYSGTDTYTSKNIAIADPSKVDPTGSNYLNSAPNSTDKKDKMCSLKVTELAKTWYKNGASTNVKLSVKTGSYTLSVRINDTNHDFAFNVSVPRKVIWPSKLTKTSYWVGDSLDLTGDYLTVEYRNGDTGKVAITADWLYGIANSNSDTPGKGANYARCLLNDIKASTYLNTPGTYSLAIIYDKIDSTFKSGYSASTDSSYATYTNSIKVTDSNRSTPYAVDDQTKLYSANGPIVYEINVSAASGYTPKLRYSAHVQNIGWQGFYYAPDTAGTTGKSLRMEALKVQFVNYNASMGTLEYMAHVQNIGDTKWITADEMVGTVGESKRMEGVAIRFTDKYAELYNVEYRVHVQGIGWTDWKKNGEYAGTKSEGKRMEAIEIRTSLR